MGETRRPEGAAMLARRCLKRNAQITDGKGIFVATAGALPAWIAGSSNGTWQSSLFEEES